MPSGFSGLEGYGGEGSQDLHSQVPGSQPQAHQMVSVILLFPMRESHPWSPTVIQYWMLSTNMNLHSSLYVMNIKKKKDVWDNLIPFSVKFQILLTEVCMQYLQPGYPPTPGIPFYNKSKQKQICGCIPS